MSAAPIKSARQRGGAALELAIIMPLLVLLLAFPFSFGRVFVHYAATTKACNDAARYLVSVPENEWRSTSGLNGTLAVARAILAEETAELNPGPWPISFTILCDTFSCMETVPFARVRVAARMRIVDPVFSPYTAELFGDEGMLLAADVTLPYTYVQR